MLKESGKSGREAFNVKHKKKKIPKGRVSCVEYIMTRPENVIIDPSFGPSLNDGKEDEEEGTSFQNGKKKDF